MNPLGARSIVPLRSRSNSQPRKSNDAQITERQINEIKRPVGKILLRKFLETDQQDEDQAAFKGERAAALVRARAEDGQIDEQGEDPVQDKMSRFIGEGKMIQKTKIMR